MGRWLVLACTFLTFAACGGGDAAAPVQPTPASPPASPAPTPPPASPAAPPDNPCTHPALQTLEVEMGVMAKTPWELELTYALDEDKNRGPGFMFLFHSGARRWETRRDLSNWAMPLIWHGFCWRGAARPALRAQHLRVEVVPLCRDGKLIETGSCTPAFKP